MVRARLLKKTFYYLWRDLQDIAEGIVIPVLAWLVIVFVGLILSATSTYFITNALEISDPDHILPLVIMVAHGFGYWGVCSWIHGAYQKAQQTIHNENNELVSNIKDPK